MIIFIVSFFAGFITVLAPCVLPVLPVILGGTLNESNYKRIITIILSFVLSIILFTFLLKVSTVFISIDQSVWKNISGTILILYGLVSLYPSLWDKFKIFFPIPTTGFRKKHDLSSIWGQIILGASLGPIFSTCSPTYSLIIATILPLSLVVGTINIIMYALGLGFAVGLVAVFGRSIIKKFHLFSSNDSRFRKGLALLIIFVGILILTSYDKYIESMIVGSIGSPVIMIEERALEAIDVESNPFCKQ